MVLLRMYQQQHIPPRRPSVPLPISDQQQKTESFPPISPDHPQPPSSSEQRSATDTATTTPFPSNAVTKSQAARGLLFAPASGERVLPSPMAIGKLSMIQATRQARIGPFPPDMRKDDFKKFEDDMIKKHWPSAKEAIAERTCTGNLPLSLSFPDLPKSSEPFPGLDSVPKPIPTINVPKDRLRRHRPPSISLHHSHFDQAHPKTAALRRSTSVKPAKAVPTSAPAGVPYFPSPDLSRRRGSVPGIQLPPGCTLYRCSPPDGLPSHKPTSSSKKPYIPTTAELMNAQAYAMASRPMAYQMVPVYPVMYPIQMQPVPCFK